MDEKNKCTLKFKNGKLLTSHYNIYSLMKFGTSNSDEEINKILNEFYKPENKNQNNDDKLIKKLKN